MDKNQLAEFLGLTYDLLIMSLKRRTQEEMAEAQEGEKKYWVGPQRNGKKLSVRQIMCVFCAWLETNCNTYATSDATGVAKNTVVKLVKEGSRGVPPFDDLIGMVEFNSLVASIGHDVSLQGYKWSPRKAIGQTLQVCDGLRKIIKDTIEDGSLKIQSWKELIEVAKAIPILETAYGKMADKFGLDIEKIWDDIKKTRPVEPKEPEPEKEPKEPTPDFAGMSVEQIEAWVAQTESEGDEPREQVG